MKSWLSQFSFLLRENLLASLNISSTFLHVVSSIKYNQPIAFVLLSKYDAIVFAKKVMRLLRIYAYGEIKR